MQTKIYRVTGKFVNGDRVQSFNEENIYEKIYSDFGSKHRINRNQIDIEEIKEITPEEVIDPIVKGIL